MNESVRVLYILVQVQAVGMKAILLACVALSGRAAWTQDRFVISFWVDPIVAPSDFDARYAEIAAADFNVLLGGFGATDRTSVAAQLAAAQRHGLAAIPSTCGGGGGSPPGSDAGACVNLTSPALWGWQLKDEPAEKDFPQLATWHGSVAAAAGPDALRFVNLLPNYATAAQQGAGARGYDAYVRDYVAAVRPDLLCADHYPFFNGPQRTSASNDTKSGYRANLRTLRAAALAAPHGPIPFWNFFNAFGFGGHADPTESQLRWQAFVSLAHGSQGLLYFMYWPARDSHLAVGQAMVAPRQAYGAGGNTGPVEYELGAKYFQAQRLNKVLRALGAVLLGARSTALFGPFNGTSSTEVVAVEDAGSALASLSGTGLGPGIEFMTGQFTLRDGRSAMLLVNHDSEGGLWATVTLRWDLARVVEVDRATGQEQPLRDDSPFTPGLQLSFESGAARLFILTSAAAAGNASA